MAQVKGTAVQSSLRYVRERFGDEAMPAFPGFMREAKRRLAAREPDVVRNMGQASCDHGVTGVYLKSLHSLCTDPVCRFEGSWE